MDQQQPTVSQRRSWWIAAIIIIVLGAGVWAFTQNRAANTNTATSNINVASQNANTAPTTYTYQGQDGKNALELLKVAYPNTTTKSSSLGEYVTGINGTAAASNQGWVYTVNGKEVTVGADKYMTKTTDTILWSLTTF